MILQANGPWTPFGDVTTITTKDTDARTGIGMRLSERGHVVGYPCFQPMLTAAQPIAVSHRLLLQTRSLIVGAVCLGLFMYVKVAGKCNDCWLSLAGQGLCTWQSSL